MTQEDDRVQEAWKTLGIEPTTDPTELRTAYRHRSMETHPDHDGSAEAFARVRSAYSVLLEHALNFEIGTGTPAADEADDPLTPWIVDDAEDEADSRVVEEQGRRRRKGFEELLLDALRREYRHE